MNPGAEKFNGFSPEAIGFLQELKTNNTKSWFESHREDYEQHLLLPLRSLAAGLAPLMLSIDQELVTMPTRVVSRIHRDIRFSHDKSPYKTNHWITFKRPKKEWQDYPAFFFEISPSAYRYGMGFYSASRQTMDNFRKSIDTNPRAFLTAISFYPEQKDFTIEGEQYKRPLKADIPKEFQAWYNRKSLYLVSNRQIAGNSVDKKLMAELMHGFESMAPFYHYLCKVAV